MTEESLYQKHIKRFLKSKGRYFYRIEHARIPDIYSCRNKQVLWIELKTEPKLSKNFLIPDWRPGQISWMKEHSTLGGEIFCLCLEYKGKYCFLEPKEFYSIEEVLQTQKEESYGFTKFFGNK